MKKYINLLSIGILFITFGCEEEDNLPFTAASLQVVHTAVNAPDVHINYFGRDITFSSNPVVSYNEEIRFTLPTDMSNEVRIVSVTDTLSQLFSTSIALEVGELGTLFLTGEGENIEGLFFNERLPTLTDSLIGVRFLNLSPDSNPVSVTVVGQDGEQLASDLSYLDDSGYLELAATQDIGMYTFEFSDVDDNVLATTALEVIPGRGTKAVFQSQTFALIGRSDDGNGGNSLEVLRINHYLKR